MMANQRPKNLLHSIVDAGSYHLVNLRLSNRNPNASQQE